MQLFRSPPPAEFETRLADGTALHVAFVTPAHAPKFSAGYARLSDHSRRMRFFGQVSSLSSKQLEFLASPDGRNHIAYAGEERCGDETLPAGVARCIRLDADSKIAEVALTILDDYQARGLGQLLHACLHRHAAAVDLKQFIYDVSAENLRFVEHLTALGAEVISRDRDVVRLTLPVFASARSVGMHTPTAERFAAQLQAVMEL